jgi:hypothetical protein
MSRYAPRPAFTAALALLACAGAWAGAYPIGSIVIAMLVIGIVALPLVKAWDNVEAGRPIRGGIFRR